MKTSLPGVADLRGFRWHLEPLRRKLEADLEGARLELAALLREEGELAAAVRELDARFLQDARDALRGPLDPQRRARALGYLTQQAKALDGHRRDACELRSRVTKAREACLTAERRLASTERLRAKAQALFAADQLRRTAKEADIAWLATRSRQQLPEYPPDRSMP